jgi:hypothetical protein
MADYAALGDLVAETYAETRKAPCPRMFVQPLLGYWGPSHDDVEYRTRLFDSMPPETASRSLAQLLNLLSSDLRHCHRDIRTTVAGGTVGAWLGQCGGIPWLEDVEAVVDYAWAKDEFGAGPALETLLAPLIAAGCPAAVPRVCVGPTGTFPAYNGPAGYSPAWAGALPASAESAASYCPPGSVGVGDQGVEDRRFWSDRRGEYSESIRLDLQGRPTRGRLHVKAEASSREPPVRRKRVLDWVDANRDLLGACLSPENGRYAAFYDEFDPRWSRGCFADIAKHSGYVGILLVFIPDAPFLAAHGD